MAVEVVDVLLRAKMEASEAVSGVGQIQKALQGLTLPKNISADLEKSFGKLGPLLKDYQKQLDKGFSNQKDLKNFNLLREKIDSVFGDIQSKIREVNGQEIRVKTDMQAITKMEKDLDGLQSKLQDKLGNIFKSGQTENGVLAGIKALQDAIPTRFTNLSKIGDDIAKAFNAQNYAEFNSQIQRLQNNIVNLGDKTKLNLAESLGLKFVANDAQSAGNALNKFLSNLQVNKTSATAIEHIRNEIKALVPEIEQAKLDSITNGLRQLEGASGGVDKLADDMRRVGDASMEAGSGILSMKTQVDQLKSSTQYFFSLRNMINLLKRGVDEAVQSVKDLDKAMTETAVVTDFKVSDMWGMLPEYTKVANELGATTQGAYETMTLYYQQGLNQQQAFALGAETMKMARIAGLDYAETTDMMTAALRGFNMELDETSAKRVNDVYSELAAITASDTEELGTAMQRTASIAHSAGMSFEGTTAFLAQAIETTREPAENLGTAMKTIVARFQELKKNPLEITEVEGEEVDFNKVDTALKSIGVSLMDANGQFRDLDKVFLDISQRWDGLTQTQQRYIATTAAGSRQQSRFIAMMSNYERTMQLMEAANNSAGASDEQFGKTMDSLESKLNKLHNAWQQFTMGIMNDSWVKGLVDTGTKVLDLVNNIINALSFNGQLKGVKSLLSVLTAFTALKAGGNIINKAIGGLGGLVDPTSTFGKGFWGAGKVDANGNQTTGLASKITTPIVSKLSELIAVTKGQKTDQPAQTSTVEQYKAAMNSLHSTNPSTMRQIGATFGSLSNEHAYTAYRNAPGTIDAMQQTALGWLSDKKLPAIAQKSGQQLMKGIFKGMQKKEIPIKQGVKLLGEPQKWGQYFGTDVAQNFSNTFSQELTSNANEIALKALGVREDKISNFDIGSDNLKQLAQSNVKYKDEFLKARQNLLSVNSLENAEVSTDRLQNMANTVGKLGSGFTSVGLSVQMFGSQLSQLSPALQGIGGLLTQVGNALVVFGMGFSGITKVITKGGAAIKAGLALGISSMANTPGVIGAGAAAGKGFITGMAGSLGIGTGVLGAAFGALIIGGILVAKQHADKKAKEAGEEVRNSFEKGFTKNTQKLESIEGYKDRLNELAQGVDEFGHNISLSDEEYDEYLSISRELTDLSPSLIAGYNAEGQAILRKGAALDEVIDKLKEEKQLSLENYISNDSISKLIGEYNTSDAYNSHNTAKKGDFGMGDAFASEKTGISQAIKDANLEWSDFSQIMNELGMGEAASINELTNRQMSLIAAHYGDIINKIKEKNPQIKEEAETGLKEAFGNANGAIEEVLSEGEPITTALEQWMGQNNLDAVGLKLGDEFVAGFNNGIKGIMLEGLTNNWKPEQYKQELQSYSDEWKKLAGSTSDYNKILQNADNIQEQYLDHIGEEGAVEQYKQNIEDSAQKLEDLANKTDTATEAGQIFAEQCIQQANALRNYATEGAVSLAEALNILSGKFTEARSAKERFDEATKGGDYYTAAEGFRSIAETVLNEKNSAGDGSLTAWTGAEALLGQQYVDTHGWKDVQKQVEKVNKLFDDGIEGVYNFNDMLVEAVNSGKDLSGLGEVIDGAFHFDFDNVDNLKQYADLLGISEDVLTGMIDKSRQFMAFNAGNNKQIRQALEQSEQAMIGQSYGKNGKTSLYTSESSFRQEAYAQGIRGDDYTKTKSDLTKEQNVRFLTVDSLKANKGALGLDNVLKDIGLENADKNLNNTVSALTKMGFDVAEQKEILRNRELSDGKVTDEAVETAYNEQEFAAENPTVAGIANDTGVIATAATALLAKMGILTDRAKKDIEKSTSQEYLDKLKNQLNPEGGFKDAASRDAARADVESQIAEYDATINNLKSSGNEALQPYIDQLESARNGLQIALDTEANGWKNKLSEASKLVEGIGDEAEQKFLQDKSVDIANIANQEDILGAANALRQLEEEGNLSHSAMAQLAADFLQFRQGDLTQLNSDQIDTLCTKLGLTKDEASQLLEVLQVPFTLEGRYEGEDLNKYIMSFEGLTDTEKGILLRADTSGEEKVSSLIDEIDREFGDGETKTKTVILEAEAKMAGGDQAGAEKILKDAGFSDSDVKQITQKLSITVNGTVANKQEVQDALTSQLNDMEISTEAKAKVSAKLDINKQQLQQSGGTITYKSSVDSGAINQAKSSAQAGAEMPIKAVDKASGTINTIRSNAGKSVSFDVSPNFTGTWTKTLTIKTNKTGGDGPDHKRGRNYSIPAHQSLSFGSAANGLNINKIPNSSKKQVTALVGEEGYEVGYIPSEGRSVIFGANGPEMTSFPSDTIIYPHGISKDIIRRGKQSQPTFGSHASGTLPSRSSSSGGGSSSDKLVKTAKDTGNKISKTAEDTAKAVNRILVWWDNAGRRANAIQRQADKNQKTYEKYLKEIQATLKTTGTIGQGNDFIANTQKAITEYQRQYNRATSELNALDTGSAAKTNKGRKKQYAKGADNIVEVSYKKGKKQKTAYMNTAGYIYQDANGAYQINQQAINKIKNKDQRKAFYEAAKKELDDRISKQNAAEDNIQKAQEALEKFSEELYNTFFAWENELTKIWNITQQIEQAQSRMSGRDAFGDLLEKQLSTGMLKSGEGSRALDLDNFKQRLELQNQALEDRQEAIKLSQQEVKKIATSEDEKTTLANVNEKLNQDAIRDSRLNQLNDAKAAKKAYDDAIDNRGHAQNRLFAIRNRINQLQKKEKLSKSQKKELASLKKQKNLLTEQIKGYDATIKDNEALANKVDEYQKSYDSIVNTHADLNETERAGYEQYKKELEDQIKAQDKARQFTKITRRGDGTIDIEFNSEAFEQERLNGNITSDMAKAIQDWVKKLEEASKNLQENYENLTKEITEYYNQLEELQQEWADYGKELTNIIEDSEKEKINKLKSLYDNIKKALDDLLAEVKRKLDDRRQQEDNAKTERDISQKQQRLAALRADTSGGHQVEIAQLEKEISEAQINYQHSLEDQLLDKLQQQIDEASKQRERQIELQEALVSSVSNIEQVNEWMERATAIGNIEDEEDRAAAYEELKEEIRGGYYAKEQYDSVSKAEQDRIAANYEQFFNGLITNQTKQQETVDEIKKLEPVIEEIRNYLKLQSLTLSTAKEKGNLTAKEAQERFGVSLSDLSVLRTEGKYTFEDFQKSNYTNAEIKQAGFEAKDFKAGGVSYADAKALNFSLDELEKGGYTEATEEKNKIAEENRRAAEQAAAAKAAAKAAEWLNKWTTYRTTITAAHMKGTVNKNDLVNAFNKGAAVDLSPSVVGWDLAAGDGKGGVTWKEVVKAAKKAGYSKATVQAWWGMHGAAATDAIKGWSKYKTGGLADYTGPAWLDGTPSKPELVLNAVDTKNFLALRDVLSGAMKSTSAISNSYGGDIMYDINIHVDKIEKDYDVDRVVDKVKKEITKGAGYRNVTQVRKFR